MTTTITASSTSIPYTDSFALFLKESEGGKNIGLLLESRSQNQKYPKVNFVIPAPAVKITGKGEKFIIEALTHGGKELLNTLGKKDFAYAQNYFQSDTLILGTVKREENKQLKEEDETKQTNIAFVLKSILAAFCSESPYAGLYGALAYDFAKNYYKIREKLPDEGVADFELFIPTKVFVINDTEKKAECVEFAFDGKKYLNEKPVAGFTFTKQKNEITCDLDDESYLRNLDSITKDILNGRAMQCVYSRRTAVPLQRHPIESYSELRDTNPAPYSFYFSLGNNEVLYGASPELHVRITGEAGHKQVHLRPIAGTISRSKNPLEDAEARRDLMTDEKELREHTMLVDLARHELYKLCEPQSVEVTDLFSIEEYPNLYHLVSGINGKMRKGKDAVDTLLVTMPAGTLSGAPKLEARKMLEEYEGSKRGFYGGAIGVISFNGDCNTGITIRSVHVKNNNSYVRGGGGVTALSTPAGEFAERKLKLEKAIQVLEARK